MATKRSHGTNEQTLRIIMLGKTGAGKSSLGNALLGKEPPKSDPKAKRDEKPPTHKYPAQVFKEGRGTRSETVYCGWARTERHGTTIEVMDTPGLCGVHLPEEQIYREVAKSLAVTEPGPNVVIYVLRCDRRFSQEEQKVFEKIKKLVSYHINNSMILVFSGLDNYNDEAETIEEQQQCLNRDIGNFGMVLQDMVEHAQGRYIGMNNKAPDDEREKQVQELIKMMKAMVSEKEQAKLYKTEKARGMDKEEATRQLKEPGIVSPVFESIGYGVSDKCSVM